MKHFTLLMFLIAVLGATGLAQTKPAAKAKPATATPKLTAADTAMPKMLVRFGPYKKGMPVLISDWKQVLNAELKVTDTATGTSMQVVSFRFGWRKKEASDDIKTGKRKIIANFQAVDVYDSPRIPEAWQAEMKENVQTKEELMFEAIIVQHPKTKKLYQAPPLFLKLL